MSLRGDVAARLIRARIDHRGEGPGHPDRGNQYHAGVSGGGVPMGGSGGRHAGSHAGAYVAAMSDAIETMGDASDPPVTMSADSLTDPSELQVEDLSAFVEAHADLWANDGPNLIARIDPKTGKVVATVAKLTTPSASASRRSLPPPVHPIEFSTANRRSMAHSLFPPQWGPPPHELRAREAWILQHCEADARGDVGKLVELRSRYLQLSIRARRFGPGET